MCKEGRRGKGKEENKGKMERKREKEGRREGETPNILLKHTKNKRPVSSLQNLEYFETNKINPIKAVFLTFSLHQFLSSSW